MLSTLQPHAPRPEMLLIHPPVTRCCEPPAGLAYLAGALRRQGGSIRLWDANRDGLQTLLNDPEKLAGVLHNADTWTRRAFRHVPRSLAALRDLDTYHAVGAYKSAILDIQRVLSRLSPLAGTRIGLAGYTDNRLSPLQSCDLISAAEKPEDNPFYPFFQTALTAQITRHPTDLIGFSLNYLDQALITFAMVGFLKKNWPSLPVVLGGGLVTSWMRRLEKSNPFSGLIDALVPGPGEEWLTDRLALPASATPVGPDYDDFPFRDYLSPGFILPFSASRGCYWRRCAFCPERAEGNPYAPLSRGFFLDQLAETVGRYAPLLIHFLDNALSPAHLEALAARPPGRPWYGFARITPLLAEEAFCRALKDSGCVMLQLGLESGDQAVLDALGKGVELTTASRALHALKEAGVGTYVYLLFGTPAESEIQARRTLRYVQDHAGAIDYLNVALFNLPTESPEARTLETRPFYAGDLSLYCDFVHPRGWQRGRVRHFLEREFKRAPAIREIIRRDPPVMTSNHAPFFIHPPPVGGGRS